MSIGKKTAAASPALVDRLRNFPWYRKLTPQLPIYFFFGGGGAGIVTHWQNGEGQQAGERGHRQGMCKNAVVLAATPTDKLA